MTDQTMQTVLTVTETTNNTERSGTMKTTLDYVWVQVRGLWKLNHTARIEITKTSHGEWRVWDTVMADTVIIKDTLSAAKTAAELYHQIEC